MELSWEPRAFLFKKFMTDEECDSVIKMVSYCSPLLLLSCKLITVAMSGACILASPVSHVHMTACPKLGSRFFC